MIYRHALLPGSYDPVTLGHLSLVKRASLFCEKVSACVFVNPAKSCLFSIEERKSFLALACEGIPNASAHFHLGMEPEFAEKHGCDIIIKGVRDEKDLAYEKKIVTDWAKENGYTLAGEPRERYIHGSWDRKDESEWITELQLPIGDKG